jgi:hypothetical protein
MSLGAEIEGNAERELTAADREAIRQRAEAIARSPETAAEIRTHAEIMIRAEEIKRSRGAGSDLDNWVRAESEIRAYHERISERAKQIAASPEAALGHWLQAEQELRAAGLIG